MVEDEHLYRLLGFFDHNTVIAILKLTHTGSAVIACASRPQINFAAKTRSCGMADHVGGPYERSSRQDVEPAYK